MELTFILRLNIIKTMPFKKWRLKRRDFEKVLKKGKSFREDSLILKVLKHPFQKIRIGFLLAKKHFPKAVLRNRLKRKLKEMIRGEVHKIKNGLALVFICLPGIEKKGLKDLKNIFQKLIIKSKILKQ